MKPLIYALDEEFDKMKWHPNTGNMRNKKEILRAIGKQYEIDLEIMQHIQIVKEYGGYHFGICGVPLTKLLYPFWRDEVLDKLRSDHFPQLTNDMLFSVVFSIFHIIDSTRLDIRTDLEQQNDHWYFYKTKNGYTRNRQYFYEGLQNYILTGHITELIWNYLMTTSHSSTGGLMSVAYFDIRRIDDVFDIVIPNTQFTYADILQVIVEEPYFHKLIYRKTEFLKISSLATVRAGLLFLQMLWNCFTISAEDGQLVTPSLSGCREHITRNELFQGIRWTKGQETRTYENCHFLCVDFTGLSLENDFLCCIFERCNLTGMSVHVEGLPMLRCEFIDCIGVPKDPSFQCSIKNCYFNFKSFENRQE